MGLGLDDLKSTIAKKGGMAPANRFNVFFTPPTASLININPQALLSSAASGNLSVKNFIADPRDISILCESVSLPGRNLNTLDYQSNKQPIKMPYGFADDDVQMTFLLTNDYFMKDLFERWQGSVISTGSYTANYKSEYVTDVTIMQTNQKDIPVYGVRLINAFPTTIAAIELNSTSESTFQRVSVTLSYDRYVPEGALTSSVSALRSAAQAVGNISADTLGI